MRVTTLFLLMGLLLLVSSVTATIDTQFLPETYIPYQYEFLLIGIGVSFFIAMWFTKESDILIGLLSVIFLGASAWFAAYMCIENVFYDGTTVTYTQLVTPEPVLQVILVVCFLFAIVSTVYVWALRNADKVLEQQPLMRRGG